MFRVIWCVTSNTYRTNAKKLQAYLKIGSYRTVWTLLHKLRLAMTYNEENKLKGIVEATSTPIGDESDGKLYNYLAVAVEISSKNIKQFRMGVLENDSSETLYTFIKNNVEIGSNIESDEYYINELSSKEYNWKTNNDLPNINRIISVLSNWLYYDLPPTDPIKEHFGSYIKEFCFKYNWGGYDGELFYELIKNAVQLKPTTYKDIILK